MDFLVVISVFFFKSLTRRTLHGSIVKKEAISLPVATSFPGHNSLSQGSALITSRPGPSLSTREAPPPLPPSLESLLATRSLKRGTPLAVALSKR